MKAGEARFAPRGHRAGLAALFSVLLASCTATTGGAPVALGPTSFNGMGPTATLMADVAAEESASADGQTTTAADGDAATQPTEAVDGEAVLPTEVAYVPAARPVATATAAAQAVTSPASPSQPAGEQTAAAAHAETAAPAQANTQPAAEAAGQTAAAAPTEASAAQTPPQQFASAAPAPKKKGFLASFFGQSPAKPTDAAQAQLESQTAAKSEPEAEPESAEPEEAEAAAPKPLILKNDETKPIITLASAERPVRRSANLASLGGEDDNALPGVRQSALFEISRKSGLDDDSDVDLHEDEGGGVQMAMAGGFARLAPNGLLKQRESVDTTCLKPSLVRMLKTVERHYGKKMIVTSGYRSPSHNRRVRGARKSMHMYCAAADVQMPGVSKWELARYVRSMSGRGGVGTYCHTNSVHIDVGPERDWNWRCRRRKA